MNSLADFLRRQSVEISKNYTKVFVLAIVICLLPGLSYAQDPGIRDTVRIECDSLIVGQSRAVRLVISNDEPVSNFIMPFWIFSVDSGFAVYDSIKFVGRMADPSVMEARIPHLREINGVSPDSIQVGALRLAGNDLPPGNSVIAEMYFTGLMGGVMRVDTAAFVLTGGFQANHLQISALQADGTYRFFNPQFSTENIQVFQSFSLPTINVNAGDYRSSAGELVTFEVQVSSPEGIPVNGFLSSFTRYDNNSILPSTDPFFSYNPTEGNYEFAWTSSAADVGIWKAVISACDTNGHCSTYEIEIQILESTEFIIEMLAQESSGFNFSSSMKCGNFDQDPNPEIASAGWGHNATSLFALYDNNGEGTYSEVFIDKMPDQPRRGLGIGYIDGDENLDVVHFITSGEEIIKTFLGNGQNGFPIIQSTQISAYGWGLVASLGNFDNDQYLDYAIGGRNKLNIFEGTSSNSFDLKFDLNVVDSIMSLVSKDLNNDGRDDFIIGHRGGLKVYLGQVAGPPIYAASYTQTFGSLNIDITNEGSDFNGDNYFDLCVSTPSIGDSTSEIMVYLGRGDGTFEQRVTRTLMGQVVSNTNGDFNNDGEIDIGYVNSSRQYLGILFGDGDGNFTNEIRFDVPKNDPSKLLCTDVDLDGDLDLIVNSSRFDYGSSLFVYYNESNPVGFSSKSVALYGEDNAQLELVSATGKVLNRVANSMPSANYYRRNLNLNDKLDDYADLNLVENGDYVLTVRPDPSQPIGTPFTVEFSMDGKLYRLAKDVNMAQEKYEFGVCLSLSSTVSPRTGNFIYADPPVFMWPDKAMTRFQISSDINFSNILIDTTVNSSLFQPAVTLDVLDTTTFYWRIKPTGAAGFGPTYVFNLMPGSPACGDIDGVAGPINFLDLVFLAENFFRGGDAPPDFESADLDNDGRLNILDMNLLVGYLFRSGLPPVCAR